MCVCVRERDTEKARQARFSETWQRKKISQSQKYREQLFSLALAAWYSAPPIAIAIWPLLVVKRTFDVLLHSGSISSCSCYCYVLFFLSVDVDFNSGRMGADAVAK
jgi:hypothetical protein